MSVWSVESYTEGDQRKLAPNKIFADWIPLGLLAKVSPFRIPSEETNPMNELVLLYVIR